MPNFELYFGTFISFLKPVWEFFLFLDRFSCNLGCPEICYLAKMALDAVASTSQICATMLALLTSVCFVRRMGGWG